MHRLVLLIMFCVCFPVAAQAQQRPVVIIGSGSNGDFDQYLMQGCQDWNTQNSQASITCRFDRLPLPDVNVQLNQISGELNRGPAAIAVVQLDKAIDYGRLADGTGVQVLTLDPSTDPYPSAKAVLDLMRQTINGSQASSSVYLQAAACPCDARAMCYTLPDALVAKAASSSSGCASSCSSASMC